MNKLQTMLKNPHIRFKTIGEMVADYGSSWFDEMPWFEPDDAVTTMTIYQGKILFPSLVKPIEGVPHIFLYGPTDMFATVEMLTTKQLPKYDLQGNILKPGMIVKIEYSTMSGDNRLIVGPDLRNEAGTLVKVLKVYNPSDYMTTCDYDKERLDRTSIATELRNPRSGGFIDEITRIRKPLFKDGKVCAIESIFRVVKATDIEKEFYHKTTSHGTQS